MLCSLFERGAEQASISSTTFPLQGLHRMQQTSHWQEEPLASRLAHVLLCLATQRTPINSLRSNESSHVQGQADDYHQNPATK